jgi:nitrate/nitrite transporter NarK
VTVTALARDVVIVTAAISAGIHGALVPTHFAEGTGAGLGFVAATVLLGGVAIALTRRAASAAAAVGAAVTFAALLTAYVLATTTGLPVLHPEAEPTDGLALMTKAIEAVGWLAALRLLRRPAPRPRRPFPTPRRSLT